MQKAFKCQLCDNLCYYDHNNRQASRKDQVIYHYFLGWGYTACASFSKISVTDTDQIIREAKNTINQNGAKISQGLQLRYEELTDEFTSLQTEPQINLFLDRVKRLQHGIANAALSTAQHIPTKGIVESVEVAILLQASIRELRQKAVDLQRNKS